MITELIYHYTDLKGLLGIIDDKAIWATDVRYLNDSSEHSYGWDCLNELLKAEAARRHGSPHFFARFVDDWPNHRMVSRRTFVACFSTRGNQLSQWRGYGRQGFSIGIDRQAFEELAEAPPRYSLIGMLYSGSDKSRAITEAIDSSIAEVDEALQVNDHATSVPLAEDAIYQTWSSNMLIALLPLIPQLKDYAFREEREVRAVYHRAEVPVSIRPQHHRSKALQGSDFLSDEPVPIHVREGPLGPTPYIELSTGRNGNSTIREIRVGPTQHKEEARNGVRDLLNWKDLSEVNIKVSKIPLRW